MGASSKAITKIEIAKIELEAAMNMIINGFKSEIGSYIYMKLSPLSSNISSLSHYQPSDYIIKWSLLKSPKNVPMHHNSPNIYIP